jgi:hypothetical protein
MTRSVVLFFFSAFLCYLPGAQDSTRFPVAYSNDPREPVVFVREMAYIPEVDTLSVFPNDTALPVDSSVYRCWKKAIPVLGKQLTAQRVRDLSGWSHKQMEQYSKVSFRGPVAFKVIRISTDSTLYACEAILDTLPSHEVIITRWLKAYIVYNKKTKTAGGLIITIRGQILE